MYKALIILHKTKNLFYFLIITYITFSLHPQLLTDTYVNFGIYII